MKILPPSSDGLLRSGARAFSLVELLTVVALIAILSGLVLPAVSSMLSGRDLRRAMDGAWGLLSAGRQEALTRQLPVAAVVTTGRTVGTSDRTEAVILLAADRSSGENGEVLWNWKPLSGWRKLAPGVETSPGSGFQQADAQSFQAIKNVLPKLDGDEVETFCFIIFQSDGSVQSVSAELKMGLSRRQWRVENPTNSETYISVIPETGRIRTAPL